MRDCAEKSAVNGRYQEWDKPLLINRHAVTENNPACLKVRPASGGFKKAEKSKFKDLEGKNRLKKETLP